MVKTAIKTRTSLLVVLALTCIPSCAVKELDAQVPPTMPGSTLLHASIAEDTKALLDAPHVLWEEGDCINVMTIGSHDCGSYSLVDGAGTTAGTFSGGDIPDSPKYYALYPYMTGLTKTNNRYNFRIPQEQTWKEGSFGTGANIMEATFTDPTQPLQFRNVMGLLKLSLTGTTRIYKISVSDANTEKMLWGNAKLLLDGKECTADQTLELTDGDNTVNLNCPNGVQLSTSTPTLFYLALPPGALSTGMTVRVYGENDILLDQFGTVADNTIVRSQVRAMPSRAVVSDPSLNESANCYILYRPGLYKVKAVKGNSSEELTGVKDAILLWEGSNSSAAPAQNSIISNVSYSNGYVYFTLEEGLGNAALAVRDAQDNILWSWHIWVPQTEVKALARASDYLMDRNLGASLSESTDGVATIGLLYEWGRKDPFPGCVSWSGASYMGTVGNAFGSSERTSSTGTIAYATAHPQEYLYCTTDSDADQDWLYTHDGTLWAAEKTIYDPCPPGYHVPGWKDWYNKSVTFETAGPCGANVQYYGDNVSWFPTGGYRYTSDGSNHNSGQFSYYWAYDLSSNKAYTTRIKIDGASSAVGVYSMCRSAGLNVRCIADSMPETSVEPRPAEGSEADEVKDFLDALPSGAKVTSITSTASGQQVGFSNGTSVTLDSSVFSTETAVADGNWHVDGTATDAATTSGNYLLHLPRKVIFHFADGAQKSFDKDIDWGMYVQKTATRLYIYMGHAGSNNWIRYDFYYRNKAYTGGTTYPDYYDNWGLGKPYTCTRSGNSFTLGEELFLGGEAEAAVQTYDAREPAQKTYSGGVLHGWENIYTDGGDRQISIRVDGEAVGESSTFALKTASRIEIEQKTKIARAYSPEGLENAYADVVKHWVIENGTVTISVEYTFLQETEIFQGKFGMFCVKRLKTAKNTGSGYITRLAWKDSTPSSMYEVTEGWESAVSASAPLKSRDNSARRVEEYGDAGVSFAMQFDGGTLKSGGGFNIGTNGNNYNKIYFDICGNYTASQNEKLSSTVHWELDFVEDFNLF